MKTLKAKCIHCGKEVFSLYKKQLDYNIKAHEISCPKLLGEGASVKSEDPSSNSKEKESSANSH